MEAHFSFRYSQFGLVVGLEPVRRRAVVVALRVSVEGLSEEAVNGSSDRIIGTNGWPQDFSPRKMDWQGISSTCPMTQSSIPGKLLLLAAGFSSRSLAAVRGKAIRATLT